MYAEALINRTQSYQGPSFSTIKLDFDRKYNTNLIKYIALKVLTQLRTNQKKDKIKLNWFYRSLL